jgi:hypothetical protein
VLWERTPNGDVVWDDSYQGSYPDNAERWFRENFPQFDPDVRVRVVEASEYANELRSDRRFIKRPEKQPPWPSISPGEYNLDQFISPSSPTPGVLLTLAEFEARFLPL